MSAYKKLTEDAIGAFLQRDYPGFIAAREQARQTFVDSRYNYLLEEFALFSGELMSGIGPWLLQLEPTLSPSGEKHFWVHQDLLPGDIVTEEELRGLLFGSGTGESWPGRDEFVRAFNGLLEEKGINVRLRDNPFRQTMRFVLADGFHY
jgi:hypothetical protein